MNGKPDSGCRGANSNPHSNVIVCIVGVYLRSEGSIGNATPMHPFHTGTVNLFWTIVIGLDNVLPKDHA